MASDARPKSPKPILKQGEPLEHSLDPEIEASERDPELAPEGVADDVDISIRAALKNKVLNKRASGRVMEVFEQRRRARSNSQASPLAAADGSAHDPADGPSPAKRSRGSAPRRPRIKWDEGGIQEQEEERRRHPKQKIDEAPTPYEGGEAAERALAAADGSDGSSAASLSPSQLPHHHGGDTALLHELEPLDVRSPVSLEAAPVLKSPGLHVQDEEEIERLCREAIVRRAAEDEWDSDEDADQEAREAERKRRFKEQRRAHYDEFQKASKDAPADAE